MLFVVKYILELITIMLLLYIRCGNSIYRLDLQKIEENILWKYYKMISIFEILLSNFLLIYILKTN